MINKMWTDKSLQEEALKYTTKSDFRRNCKAAYSASIRRKILDKVCAHMVDMRIVYNDKRKIWNPKTIAAKAKEYSTKKEFEQFASGAYTAAKRYKILDIICKHMTRPKSIFKKKIKWNIRTAAKEALKYKSKTDFKKGNRSAFIYAEKNGILDQICAHTKKDLGKHDSKRINIVKNNSQKCTSRADFYWKYRKDYEWAWRHKLLNLFCGHMIETKLIKNQPFWTESTTQSEALKYNTKQQFRTMQAGAYDAALRLKILDKICNHMDKTIVQRELKFQKKFHIILKNLLPKITILKEARLVYNENKYCIPDFILYDHKKKIVVIIELKHDESNWTKKSINKQMERYNKLNLKSYKKKIFLVSPNGKYGINLKDFLIKLLTLF